MALKPRMTRAAVRLCLAALEYYLPTITNQDTREMALDTIKNLRGELMHTALNREKQQEKEPQK